MSVTEEMKHELSDERPYAWIVHNARSGLRTLAFDTSERDRAIKAGGYVTPVWATASQAGRAPSPEPTEAEVEAALEYAENAMIEIAPEEVRELLIAASRSRPAESKAGMVKPLEWTKPHLANTLRRAETVVGTYRTWTHAEAEGKWFWELSPDPFARVSVSGEGATEQEVQAAAQADYEARILSALEPVAEAKAEPVDLTELLEWRDHDSQSEITYTGFGPYMVERLAEDRFRAWFPDEAQVARIMVEGFAGRSEARNACQNDLDGRRALRLVRECAPFLYPGETPLQRIERERKDVDRLLSALAAAKEAKATPVPPVAQQRDEVIEECAKAALGDQVNDRRAADPDHPDSDYAAGRVDAAAAIRALSPERKDQSNG